LRFRQQNSVGHQFDISGIAGLIIESDLETDMLSQTGIQLAGNSTGYAARGNSTGLRMSDQASNSKPLLQSDQWQLS
jgi:hypothetical protein